mmetsp:Transcript_15217/g.33026  ORF Transcript_15217/g.33026 Transcript_15217/m.33026 type:complete len:81 (-) Transcript_15217:435-677(-)
MLQTSCAILAGYALSIEPTEHHFFLALSPSDSFVATKAQSTRMKLIFLVFQIIIFGANRIGKGISTHDTKSDHTLRAKII